MDFTKILDNIIDKELNKKELSDNFSLPILVFLVIVPILFGIAGAFFDASIIRAMVYELTNKLILSTIIGILIAVLISLFISLPAMRSAKFIRLTMDDILKDGKVNHWKNLIYALLFIAISFGGLKCTLYLSNHTKYLAHIISDVQFEDIEDKLTSYAAQSDQQKDKTILRTDVQKQALQEEYEVKINANAKAQNISAKQSKLNAEASTLRTKYKRSTDKKRDKWMIGLAEKKELEAKKLNTNYEAALQQDKQWLSNQLSALNHSTASAMSRQDSLNHQLSNLYISEVNWKQELKHITAAMIKGGNRIFNIYLFAASLLFGLFVVKDFSKKKR